MKSSFDIPKHWTFRSRKVAHHFNQHVREQLPWYDIATQTVAHFGRHYIPRGGVVYDIGASTGNIGLALKETLDQRLARFTAIEESQEMAERYVREIRAMQPEGPYYLAGFCRGARIAYEMSRRLREQGQRVALLALIDTVAPGHELEPGPGLMGRLRNFAALCTSSICELLLLKKGERVDYLRRRFHLFCHFLDKRPSFRWLNRNNWRIKWSRR